MNIIELIADILPKYCINCLKYGSWICTSCGNHFKSPLPQCLICRRISTHGHVHPKCKEFISCTNVISSFYLYEYNRITRKYLKYIKYRSATILLKNMLQGKEKLLPTYLHGINLKQCLILPIPLHKAKYRERGFNQSDLIAKWISHITEVPINENVLIRVKNRKSQTTIKREQRQKNVEGSFKLNLEISKEALKDVTDLILVDDVITTGATILECARTIQKSFPQIDIHLFSLFRPRAKFSKNELVPVSNRKICQS